MPEAEGGRQVLRFFPCFATDTVGSSRELCPDSVFTGLGIITNIDFYSNKKRQLSLISILLPK